METKTTALSDEQEQRYHYETVINIVAEMVLEYLAKERLQKVPPETDKWERGGGFVSTGTVPMAA